MKRKRRQKGKKRPLSFILLFSLPRPRPFSLRKMTKLDDCEWVAGYPGNNNQGIAWQIQFAMALPDSFELHACELVCVLHIMASCGWGNTTMLYQTMSSLYCLFTWNKTRNQQAKTWDHNEYMNFQQRKQVEKPQQHHPLSHYSREAT